MSTITVNNLPVATWNHLGVNGVNAPDFPEKTDNDIFEITKTLPAYSKEQELLYTESGDDVLERFLSKNSNARYRISIEKGIVDPVYISAHINEKNSCLYEDSIISVEEEARVNIYHTVTSNKEVHGRYSGLLKVHAKKGSKVHITLAQLFTDSIYDWSQLVIKTEEGACVEVVRVLLGTNQRLNAVKAVLDGNNSSFSLDTYYNVKDNNTIDINDVVIHAGTHTTSDMYIGGILDGNSSKIYRGTIDFRKGAVKSIGKEIDDVLLMSPNVHNKTCPLILCGEESVAGEHAATIGRFNDEQLFYLCSRGLTVEKAKQLLVDAKLHNVISKIKDENLQETVRQFAKEG